VLFYFWAMRKWLQIHLGDAEQFINQLVEYSSEFEHFLLFNSNKNQTASHLYSSFEILAACGSIKTLTAKNNHFDAIKKFNKENKDWIFGHLNYDLKNDLENLSSSNADSIEFPEFFFFIPRYLIKASGSLLEIGFIESHNSDIDAKLLIKKILSLKVNKDSGSFNIKNIQHNYTKSEYINEVDRIKQHILLGDIYELNFCTEFLAKKCRYKPGSCLPKTKYCFTRTFFRLL
jgi:para-aminobenzoate synthetase component 1